MSNPTVNNPFQQGQSAARHPCGTWFDCPYSSFKGPVDAYKQRQWFRGWDQEKRRDSLPVIGPYGNIMIDRIRNIDRAVIGAYGQVMIARRAEGGS